MQRVEMSEDEMHGIITVTKDEIRVTVEKKIEELQTEPGSSSEDDTTESTDGRAESIASDVVEEGYVDATDDEDFNAGRAEARLAYWSKWKRTELQKENGTWRTVPWSNKWLEVEFQRPFFIFDLYYFAIYPLEL